MLNKIWTPRNPNK